MHQIGCEIKTHHQRIGKLQLFYEIRIILLSMAKFL